MFFGSKPHPWPLACEAILGADASAQVHHPRSHVLRLARGASVPVGSGMGGPQKNALDVVWLSR